MKSVLLAVAVLASSTALAQNTPDEKKVKELSAQAEDAQVQIKACQKDAKSCDRTKLAEAIRSTYKAQWLKDGELEPVVCANLFALDQEVFKKFRKDQAYFKELCKEGNFEPKGYEDWLEPIVLATSKTGKTGKTKDIYGSSEMDLDACYFLPDSPASEACYYVINNHYLYNNKLPSNDWFSISKSMDKSCDAGNYIYCWMKYRLDFFILDLTKTRPSMKNFKSMMDKCNHGDSYSCNDALRYFSETSWPIDKKNWDVFIEFYSDLMRKSCENGSGFSCYDLASITLQDTSLITDEEQYKKLMNKSILILKNKCDAGNGSACLYLAFDENIEKSNLYCKKATKSFQKRCEDGAAYACNYVSYIYDVNGYCGEENESLSKEFYEKHNKLLEGPCNEGDGIACWARGDAEKACQLGIPLTGCKSEGDK